MRVLRVYSSVLLEGFNKTVFWLRYGVESTMRSPALSVSAKRQLSGVRALEHRGDKYIIVGG